MNCVVSMLAWEIPLLGGKNLKHGGNSVSQRVKSMNSMMSLTSSGEFSGV